MDDAAWQAGFVRTLGMLLSGTAIQEVDERGEQITGDTVLVLLNGHTDTVTLHAAAGRGQPAVAPRRRYVRAAERGTLATRPASAIPCRDGPWPSSRS